MSTIICLICFGGSEMPALFCYISHLAFTVDITLVPIFNKSEDQIKLRSKNKRGTTFEILNHL